jgi:hypothetical protein
LKVRHDRRHRLVHRPAEAAVVAAVVVAAAKVGEA